MKRWYYVPLCMELFDPCAIVLVGVLSPEARLFTGKLSI